MENKESKFTIFKPTKSSMQSGLSNTKKWCLTNKDIKETYLSSKFCWTGIINSDKEIKIFFKTQASAVRFAKKNNLDFEIEEDKERKIFKKCYAENFVKKE